MSRTKPKLLTQEHIQGGTITPYDYTHLTSEEYNAATQVVSDKSKGLMPAGVVDTLKWVAPPANSNSSGNFGYRAIDSSDYFYVCVAPNSWRRCRLESW
jgi:hypothetical protein